MTYYDEIRKKVAALPIAFQEKGIVKNALNGIETESLLFTYEGSKFIYVEGKKGVTLGWDPDTCKLGEQVTDVLKSYFEERQEYYASNREELWEYYEEEIRKAEAAGDYTKIEKLKEDREEDLEGLKEPEEEFHSFDAFMECWNQYLKYCLSPLRQADIGPMLAEVDSNYLKKDMTYDTFIEELKLTPFSLPTEDEWEYLCNGGTRTLFRWGDSLKEEMNEMFETGQIGGGESKLLTQPNMFGLFISYNSYKYELIDSLEYTKGGDGGCSLCGGDGLICVAPCYTAFYRAKLKKNDRLSRTFYSFRRIVRL